MYYIAGGGVIQKRKGTKTWKSRVKRKWWVLAQPPYSLQGNWRQSLRVELWNHGDRPPAARTQGADIIKGWEDKRDRGRITDTFI